MGATLPADFLLDTRGTSRELGAHVSACAFDRTGDACAFALGDGVLHLAPRGVGEWAAAEAHDGSAHAVAPAPGGGWVSGGDDGRLARVGTDGTVSEVANFGGKWVEQVASWADDKGPRDGKGGLVACAAGRTLHLFDAKGAKLKALDHPSTVTGIAFDAKGKRVGASHYNGASLWFVASKSDTPRKLEWKGSHTGIAIHPAGEAVVTSMQENALHGWRLSDGQHMRMSGYPTKTESLSFSRNGKWLASSGADSVVLWPFFGGGPMGKAPLELAGGDGLLCSRVACHPQQEAVACGYADGLVVLADIGSKRILPVAGPGRGRVTALAWSGDGSMLAFGTETGFAALVDFTKT